MRWVPFVFGCAVALTWWTWCHRVLSSYCTVTTTLLVGLAMDALMQIHLEAWSKSDEA